MNIMIIGGCGFIGSHVVGLLHENHSNKLFIFDDLSTGKLENIRHLISTKHNTRIRFEMLDVKRREHVDDAFCRFAPQAVILLASSNGDYRSSVETNILGMLNVIEAAKKYSARRIILSSTSAVYRGKRWGKLKEMDFCRPRTPYTISKLAAENYLQSQFYDSVVLRFGNVYGPRQETGVIPTMIRHFKTGGNFHIFGNGKQKRDYVYVADAARAMLQAMTGKPGIYNIGTGRSLSVNDLARGMEEIYDVRGYKWEYQKEDEERWNTCLDVRAAEENLGWRAEVKFMDGLKQTVDWWEKTPPEHPEPVKIPLAYEVAY